MSKYKTGDKFVIEVKEKNKELGGPFYEIGWEEVHTGLAVENESLYKMPRLEDVVKDEVEKARQDGAGEAWEIARKIVALPSNGGYTDDELREIFGEYITRVILDNNSFAEAKAKIEKWEKEKEEIHIGDIVEYPIGSGKEIYISDIWEEKEIFYGFSISDGGVYSDRPLSSARKTGRRVEWDKLREVLRG